MPDTDPKALRAVAMRAEGGYANLLGTTVLALLDRLDAAEAKADRLDDTNESLWSAQMRAETAERERDEARVRELEHHDGQTRAALAHHTAMLVPLLAVAEVAKALSERFAMLAEDGEVEECPFCFAEVQDEECASDCELTRLHFALQDVDAVGLTVARGALLGMSDDNLAEDINGGDDHG